MFTIKDQILSADSAICGNIDNLSDQRNLLAQNILSQLRNLVEGVIVLCARGALDNEFHYHDINPSCTVIKGNARVNFLTKFHRLLQISVSHYTVDGNSSERLMLKYYEYLHRIRRLLRTSYNINILNNLEKFPVDLDPSLKEYHQKISERIESRHSVARDKITSDRYYVHKTKPFFYNGNIYYEVTFYRAINKANKFDRIIAFTDIDISVKHSVMLSVHSDSIQVLGKTMPITIIRYWNVSIRPCEFDNFAKIMGITTKVSAQSTEYNYVMNCLTSNYESLLDIVDLPIQHYQAIKAAALQNAKSSKIFPILDEARKIIQGKKLGCNVLRYLLLRMNNTIIKSQYDSDQCSRLSNLNLKFGCIPFDQMPFCTSLSGHNPRFSDVLESINVSGREHEILARQIKANIEQKGMLYTPVLDLDGFKDIDLLISKYNQKLYRKHTQRKLYSDKGHIFECGYEDDVVSIIEKLQEIAKGGIAGYSQSVSKWLAEGTSSIDDDIKAEALKNLFSNSCVATIYGAAGTGKSTMVQHIAQYFNDKKKLFVAHTNPAIDNLKRRVSAQNSVFRTIRKQVSSARFSENFDLLIVDECSTVSNKDFIALLESNSFKLIVLVGDTYQIESIQFGNWFSLISEFIPSTSVFELTTPFRAKSESLLRLWSSVRSSNDDVSEILVKNNYTTNLDSSLFYKQSDDEIILCLNYDGLYGINNINRFLQSGNYGAETIWRESSYKVGDPVLFTDGERFRPVIYNNLKGWIVDIASAPGWIQFDVRLDRPLNEFDVNECDELKWITDSTVRFTVYDHPDTSDDDDDSFNTTVPFQVAYAVSIHKAQGLEYESVKIVITDSNEEDITHSIFYTAITRTRERLRIYWTPETQQRVLEKLSRTTNSKDVHILRSRRGVARI